MNILLRIILLTGVWLVLQVGCLQAAGCDSDSECEIEDFAYGVLSLVNQEREKQGLTPLVMASDLTAAAVLRAEELTEVFSHTRPNGEPCFSVIAEQKRTVGENIAAGQPTPEDVMDCWLSSPGHRANILNPDFRELGVGYLYREGEEYRHYWVQLFRG